jgi:uncharacterized repeat protein (TIGR03803 family)
MLYSLQTLIRMKFGTSVSLNGRQLIVTASVTLFFAIFALSAGAAALQTLPNNVFAVVSRLQPVTHLPESRHLDLVIALPLRNQETLTNLLRQIYDPTSPGFHHYLTPEQFAEQFGPEEKDYQAVAAFAKANGLAMTGTHSNRTLLDVNGPVNAIEKAFHVHLRTYHHPTEGRDFFAPDVEPSLNLSVPILGIGGLDNFVLPHPMGNFTNFFNQPLNTIPFATGSGPRGNFIGKDFRTAYAPGATLDGTGQSVGLFELDTYYPSDIADYENLAGLPNVPLTNVLVDGFSASPGGDNVEVALDIDMAIAMAPGLSKVIVYEGYTPNDVLNRMATDDSAKQLSCSWSFGSSVDPVREQIFEQFAAQGQSFFQASGDVGAGPIYPPSDDPFVTAVGGTSLTTSTNGAWEAETTWPESSGGISVSYPIPLWQQGINMTTNQGSTTMRNVPDVACMADGAIWLIANNGEQSVEGGTSAAAPLWAGFAALVNQQAAANGQPGLGFLNPAIYAIGESSNYASAFHDIVTGNNTDGLSPTNFFAVPGYDLCTGWGTPDGTNLINALRPTPDVLQIVPQTSVAFADLAGSSPVPTTQSFHLFNSSTNTLSWSLGNTSVWFKVSPASGSLPAGETATVAITPTASVGALPSGHYAATLFFGDLNDGFSLNRRIVLDVANPIEAAAGVVFSNLYSFTGGGDGANPNGLLQNTNGILYGTTQNGGSNSVGTIFQFTTNGEFNSLYSFNGGNGGANPFDVLIPGAGGNFYGTTFQDGADDNGTIFSFTPDSGLTTLVAFDITNGDLPFAGLTLGTDGNFYGTTYQGGAYGRGTAFRMTTNGALTTLYSFSNGSDGGHVPGGLLEGHDGNFHGTTWKGGDYAEGTVFSISTNGTLTTLFSLNDTNGTFPFAGLAQDADGNFYGVASQGGVYGYGSVFKLNSAGEFTNLYSFTGGNDGANPRATLLLGADGNFYGTTVNGGTFGDGTAFVISPDGMLTTLVEFNGFDGANPQAALAQGSDGYLYGTTQNGGVNGKGIIFRLAIDSAPHITSQPAGQSVFAGAEVQFDVAVLGSTPLFYQWRMDGTNLADDGNITGANSRILSLSGVVSNDIGNYSVIVTNTSGSMISSNAFLMVTSSPPFIVSEPTNLTLAAGETATFSVTALGNLPLIYHWQKGGTNLTDGGSISGTTTSMLTLNKVTVANEGTYAVVVSNALDAVTSSSVTLTVVAESVPGTALSTLHWFNIGNGNGGYQPNGLMRANDGNLYGTTQLGNAAGTLGLGTIFKLTTNGIYTTLISFSATGDSPAGSYPSTTLVEDTNGNFYGMTEFDGTNDVGTVFQLTPNNTLNGLYAFTGGSDGYGTTTPLIIGNDGLLYGTGYGGDNGQGNIFGITPDGAFTNLYSFTGGEDGAAPAGGLMQGSDGNFYGMTDAGGANGYGTIFKMSPEGALSSLYAFANGPGGYQPVGELIQGTDGFLYGATEYSGTNLAGAIYQEPGTLFRITTNGTMTILDQFNVGLLDGINPHAGMIQGSDGNYYGTTYGDKYNGILDSGPSFINGTVYQLAPNGTVTNLVTFDGFDDGANPASTLVEGPDGALYGTTTTGGPGKRGTIFQLSFTSAPQITSQPANQIATMGGDATFSVAVSAAPPRFYQWQKNGTNLLDGSDLAGSTNRILTLTNVSLADSGNYSVMVSNSLGSVTSSNALLTVVIQPVFQTVAATNGTITLNWSALTGLKYQLQSNADLSSANWNNLGSVITATNGIVTVSDIIGTNTQRYYRVVLLPY